VHLPGVSIDFQSRLAVFAGDLEDDRWAKQLLFLPEHLPAAAVAVAVPSVAVILLAGLVLAACLRRRKGGKGDREDDKGGRQISGPSVLVNPLTSPYATSFVGGGKAKSLGSVASTGEWSVTGKQLRWTPPPTMFGSPRPQWRPLNEPAGGEETAAYAEVGTGDKSVVEEGDDWVEVTNKANQTPSHWVYSDMIAEESDPALNAAISTFQTYVDASGSYYSVPKGEDSAIHSAAASPAVNTSLLRGSRAASATLVSGPAAALDINGRPEPPPYTRPTAGGSVQHLYINNSFGNSPLLGNRAAPASASGTPASLRRYAGAMLGRPSPALARRRLPSRPGEDSGNGSLTTLPNVEYVDPFKVAEFV